MPQFSLKHFLETLGQQRDENVFILQIGAMDGKTGDPVYNSIKRYHWSGILVEPVQEHFIRLKEDYEYNPNIILENIAITDRDGVATMHRVSGKDVEDGVVPHWGAGLSSLYKDRNALSFDEVKPYVLEEKVPCLSLPSLLRKHEVTQIDVFQIDAEGHDYHILKQWDFDSHLPLVINLEIVNLPKSEHADCKSLLDRYGYLYAKCGYDLLAVSPQFLHETQF